MTSLTNAAARPLLALLGATLLASSALADSSLPGPYPVAQRNVTVTRPGGSTFTAQLRYPATSTSSTAPVAPAAMPAPAISFGHGFLSPVDIYDSTMDHLASHGYIVIATTSGGELFPNHANYALDMRYCLTHLEQQDLVKSSFLFGAVDETAFGISGHSMGGGASALAAGADARIKALATLAAAETNPSSANAMLTVQRPSLCIVGSQDSIVTPATTLNQYNNCDAPRQFVTIAGGSHCGFVDSAIIGCDSGSLPRPEQLAKTRALLLDFFNTHLRDDPGAFGATWGSGAPLAGTTRTRDARVSASLAQTSLSGAAGSVLETTLVATNTGPDATAIAPRALAASVDVAIDPPTSAVLAAGQSAVFTIRAASPVAATESVQVEVVRVRDDAGVPLALAIEFAAGNPADLDGDGSVGATDLATMLNAWGPCAACPADLDGDGNVGAADLAVLLGSWSN
ncbi:MAG: alpha/beta hydrolase [Planctomycetota bacterium]